MKTITRFILFATLTVFCIAAYTQTNYATLQWTVWGKQIYLVDVKTNLTDKWYPYALVAMWGNLLGTQNGTNIYSPITTNMHQPVSIEIPVSLERGFFRVYTQPENTNGVVWPTTNSRPVPFKLIPPKPTPVTNQNITFQESQKKIAMLLTSQRK